MNKVLGYSLGVLLVLGLTARPAMADWYVDLAYSQPFWRGVQLRLVDLNGPHKTEGECLIRLHEMGRGFASGVSSVPFFDFRIRITAARCFEPTPSDE